MTAADTARALALIEQHLRRAQMPRLDREKLADQILGELQSFFLMAPWPTATEEAASRAALEEMAIPGLNTATKGHT
jgi:hypothetical protein